MADNDNFEEPLKNSNQETSKFISPESNQNNQEENQNNNPGPSQDNQNNNPGPGPNNPEIFNDLLLQGIVNEDLNKKKKFLKNIFCSIMIFLIIVEIILEITALPSIDEADVEDKGSVLAISDTTIYSIFIYPPLIILSLLVLVFSFLDPIPIIRIIVIIMLCAVRGFIMKIFFTEDSKKVERFGIGLEIINGLFAATSISYNIIIMILVKKNKN